MARKLAAVAFSLGCLHTSSLMALGLGELELESFLNEPLNASVDLLNMGGLHEDEIRVRLGTSEDFEKLGLDRAYFLTNITFEVVSDGQGGARILVRSDEPVLEPYLDFIVEARWPSGRLLREYTVLIDPPVFSQSTPVVSASERVTATEGLPAPETAKKNESYSYDPNRGRVKVEESNLAAGAMPQRDYGASAQGTPTPGSRYMINRDQTLWEIASMARPDGVSVHQTMLDIQRLNPDAFINGNINRIKAGYIIYLPSAEDISSADLPTALAEVREQNAAWREGRDVPSYAGSGPSLRISAEPEESADTGAGEQRPTVSEAPSAGEPQQPGGSAGATETTGAGDISSVTLERLAALEQQLATLQRIVALKDEQIAALQNAVSNAGGAAAVIDPGAVATDAAPVTAEPIAAVDKEQVDGESAAEVAVAVPAAVDEKVAESTQAQKPKPAETSKAPAPAPTVTAEGENWTSYLLYMLGALVLLVAGFVFARRRGTEEDESLPERSAGTSDDVFADVRLQDQNVEVEPVAEEPVGVEEIESAATNNRGYGEHKHDEYASDVDAADALAEADIYIAYGRHPQAIDLLNNALVAEPGNPVYRLKLLEIYAELNNESAAMAQLKKIEDIGDPDSILRAESLMASIGVEGIGDDDGGETLETAAANLDKAVHSGPGLAPNPLDILKDSGEPLEEVFSGLEIEEPGDVAEEDDLDLSSDFEVGNTDLREDEELVIAADSNALSTKLDLARAYLDMGDDDGARQILEEVVAEGTDDLKAEARDLLDRIG